MAKENLSDADKIAFDYAWKWFDFHGKQRMQLFNYFLIITGILATAYVTSLDKKFYDVGMLVCSLGIIQSLGFIIFDIRSRDLTRRAEYALHALEHNMELFRDYKYDGQDVEICLPTKNVPSMLTSMKLWIWIIEGVILILFLCGAIYAYRLGG